MSSVCCPFGVFVPQRRHKNKRLLIFFNPKTRVSFSPRSMSSSTNDDSVSLPKQNQLGYDPSEELFGLGVDLKPRNAAPSTPKPRSWFGPNGQYIRELPCPSCRGRGYTPCTECGIERTRSDCSLCNGKGIMTCRQCLGDCVIWEESIDERPWEKAHSISPLRVKEDDEVDNLEIKVGARKKSKRVYHSPSPEVGLKISRSLKSLNAKTGLFSKRMKIIHGDPTLHAQRVAAIKNAKGTAAARKRASEALKAFFSDPENRRKRSISMKGVRFYCKHCGREGHRSFYCPELKDSSIDRRFRCRLCGERGHNRRTCPKSRLSDHKGRVTRRHRCRICWQRGHNRRTCPQAIGVKLHGSNTKNHVLPSRTRMCTCQFCGGEGHNIRTCPSRNVETSKSKPQYEEQEDS
ncbi:zinc knuckle (CCHC-type) family protein [Melia azedarach]|uniref:Zinc knuckle (CCHC-type) family protein n=1 Tax=Melia azedarach TaxID=155640 RepID=A0ACC1XIU0_MELAZ|nr:zinc knuckle (CCHC-type) family protein [Melia azedarach]